MFEIDHEFEEVPLTATPKDGEPQPIAMLNGRAIVTPSSDGSWDIDQIILDSPIDGQQTIITPLNPIWGAIHESVERHCHDAIRHKVSEFISEAAE